MSLAQLAALRKKCIMIINDAESSRGLPNINRFLDAEMFSGRWYLGSVTNQ